jgi:hypothetical protein
LPLISPSLVGAQLFVEFKDRHFAQQGTWHAGLRQRLSDARGEIAEHVHCIFITFEDRCEVSHNDDCKKKLTSRNAPVALFAGPNRRMQFATCTHAAGGKNRRGNQLRNQEKCANDTHITRDSPTCATNIRVHQWHWHCGHYTRALPPTHQLAQPPHFRRAAIMCLACTFGARPRRLLCCD